MLLDNASIVCGPNLELNACDDLLTAWAQRVERHEFIYFRDGRQ